MNGPDQIQAKARIGLGFLWVCFVGFGRLLLFVKFALLGIALQIGQGNQQGKGKGKGGQ